MPAIVRLSDVHKSYRLGDREVPALRGVDLEIAGPGLHAIMGPSGSGKSTLLHLLAALDRPDAGTIEVAGRRLDGLDEAALTRFRRREVGIIFQQYNLISTMSALDNVVLPAMLDGMPAAQRRERGAALLEKVGVAHRAGHRPDALSGGEQQRVAVARALLFEPRVVLADEPTGNLDSTTGEQIWRLFEDLTRSGERTFIIVTHEPAAAVRCRDVALLRDGRIDDTFDVDDLDAAQLATRAQRALV